MHKRFGRRKSVEAVYWRYKRWNGMFDKQVRLLQADERFLSQCSDYYAQGYKDWHLVGAISNTLLNFEARRKGIPHEPGNRNPVENLMQGLKEVEYPVGSFLGQEFERYSNIFIFTCLQTYGFETRGFGYALEPIKKFLKERMKHFEIDIEHKPMFAKPVAWWPELGTLEETFKKYCD